MVQTRKLVCTSILATALLATGASASITDLHISGSETTIFSDDFTNNSSNWTATNPDDIGTFGGTQLTQTVWQPTTAGSNATVKVTASLPKTVNISNGPINLYCRVAVQNSGANNNRFFIQLKGVSSGLFGFQLAPGNAANTMYLGSSGLGTNGTGTAQSVSTVYAPTNNTFISYRLTFAANGSGGYTLTEYIYNETQGQYVLYGTGTNDSAAATSAILGTGTDPGNFGSLQIMQRNATGSTNADYFDAVAVTQTSVPEPATVIGLGVGAGIALLYRRR